MTVYLPYRSWILWDKERALRRQIRLIALSAKPFAGPLPEELPPEIYMKKLFFE